MFKEDFEKLTKDYGCYASRAIVAQLLYEEAGGSTGALRELPQKLKDIVGMMRLALAQYDLLQETTFLLLKYVEEMPEDVKVVDGEVYFKKRQDF